MSGFRGKSGGDINRRLHGMHQGYGMRGGKAGGVSLMGSAALGDTFNYNGVAAPVEFRFDGNEFAAPWVGSAGNATLAKVAGTPVVTTAADPFGGTAPSFTGNGANNGEYYQEAGNTVGDLDLEDAFIEMVIKFPPLAGSGGICTTQRHPSIDHGWVIRHSATVLIMGIRDAIPVAVNFVIPRATLVDGEYNLIIFGFDRSGNGRGWTGVGGAIAPLAISSVGSLSTALPLTIGNYAGISLAKGYFDLAHIAMYKPTNLDLSSDADFIAACEARYALLGGTPGSTLG